LLWFESRRGAGSATDRHYVMLEEGVPVRVMKQADLPTWKYRTQLRRVLRLLDRDEVVAASDLLDELMRDVEQFRAFTRSDAFPLFRKVVVANERYLRFCIRSAEANLSVLSWIKKDLGSKPWLGSNAKNGKVKRSRRVTAARPPA
jgi:hypothetical protein